MTKILIFTCILLCAQPVMAESFLCRIFGIGCPDPNAPPPFIPVYEKNVQLLSPFSNPTPLNEWYFATQATALETCKRLGCTDVTSRPCSMAAPPMACTAPEMTLMFPDMTRNAGLYASYWTRNPEPDFPGLALKLAKMQLAAERDQAKRTIKAMMRQGIRK